jgi:preprotein translocase subunit SecG
LLEKVTWTLAISIVILTLVSNLFISKTENTIDGMSPNIDRANEQNVIQSSPNPNEIGELPQELDSIL